ncbi:Shr3 amino acid permease chaperone [Amanita muscaria]
MAVRAGVVVCVTSFLLGALFTHWIADSRTLWKSPITDEHLWIAASYYSILTKGPVHLLYFLSAMVLIGATTLFWSLGDAKAGNILFDGGSIFLFGMTVIMYLNSVLPNIFASFSILPSHQLVDPFPSALKAVTVDVASSHLICSVALTGVLALQAGRFWAEKSDEDDVDAVLSEDVKAQSSKASSTK